MSYDTHLIMPAIGEWQLKLEVFIYSMDQKLCLLTTENPSMNNTTITTQPGQHQNAHHTAHTMTLLTACVGSRATSPSGSTQSPTFHAHGLSSCTAILPTSQQGTCPPLAPQVLLYP